MPVIIVTPLKWSRSPLQIFLLLLCLATGLIIIFNKSDSKVILAMGEPWASIWGGCLAAGSLVALAGIFWRNKITGMLIERSGIVLLGSASLIWPILALKIVGLTAAFPAAATFVFGAACIWQVSYINHHTKLILDAISDAGKPNE